MPWLTVLLRWRQTGIVMWTRILRGSALWSISIFSALLFFGHPLAANSLPGYLGDEINFDDSFTQEARNDLPRASSSEPVAYSEEGKDESHGVTFSLGDKWSGTMSPGSDLYPVYIAHPIRPTTRREGGRRKVQKP